MERAELLIEIGERLKEACQRDGRSLSAIARDARIGRTNLYGFFDGEVAITTVTLARLCKALKVKSDWVIYGKE